MDPDVALVRARDAVARLREAQGNEAHAERVAADDLASAFEDLDKWMDSGGFLPSSWQEARRAL